MKSGLQNGWIPLALALPFLASSCGCLCEFQAYRATEDSEGYFVLSDQKPVALPLAASNHIEVYWKKDTRWASDSDPPQDYEVIGVVQGAAGYSWQSRFVLESNYRRAAAALGGDAVVNARLGTWLGAYPANEVHGQIVRWLPGTPPRAHTPRTRPINLQTLREEEERARRERDLPR